MSTTADDPATEALVQRIAATTNRTAPDVRAALAALEADELARLKGLDDVDLLKEGVALMKNAPPAGSTPASSIEVHGANPTNSKSQKRLVLPKPGESAQTATPSNNAAPGAEKPKGKATLALADVAQKDRKKSKISQAVLSGEAAPLTADPPPPESQEQGQVVSFEERTREISLAFQQQQQAETDEKPKLDKRAKVFLAVFGGGAVVILVLLVVLLIVILIGPGKQVVRNGDTKPKPWPLPVPPETVLQQHPWGYEITGAGQQDVARDDLLDESKVGLTLEMWIRIRDLGATEKVCLRNAEDKLQFELGCQQTPKGPKAYFMVPRATGGDLDRAFASYPQNSEWVHLCGIYDPSRRNGLRLYINGDFAAHRRCSGKAPWISSIGYSFQVKQAETASVAFDEIRISKGVAYDETFTPGRSLNLTEQTRSLLHFEKYAEGMTIDARGNRKVPLTAGKFVATGTIRMVNVDIPEACPDALWEKICMTWSVEHADLFREEWATTSDTDKRLYLAGFKTGRWPRE